VVAFTPPAQSEHLFDRNPISLGLELAPIPDEKTRWGQRVQSFLEKSLADTDHQPDLLLDNGQITEVMKKK
jgi:hypothetical protein